MINASELRIGNYVIRHTWGTSDSYSGLFGGFTSFDNGVEMQHEINGEDIMMCENQVGGVSLSPIPLTKEWLVKLRFHMNKSFKNIRSFVEHGICSSIWIIVKDGKYYYAAFGANDETPYAEGNEIKYVHQLQNLYFALTGKELEIALAQTS